jgi:hypothetical protein
MKYHLLANNSDSQQQRFEETKKQGAMQQQLRIYLPVPS